LFKECLRGWLLGRGARDRGWEGGCGGREEGKVVSALPRSVRHHTSEAGGSATEGDREREREREREKFIDNQIDD
jgi:hypothetical protein